jgi:hypothetical protein
MTNPQKFLDTPAVTAALDQLHRAINDATQGRWQSLLVVVDGGNDLGVGGTFTGCNCFTCTMRVMATASRTVSKQGSKSPFAADESKLTDAVIGQTIKNLTRH